MEKMCPESDVAKQHLRVQGLKITLVHYNIFKLNFLCEAFSEIGAGVCWEITSFCTEYLFAPLGQLRIICSPLAAFDLLWSMATTIGNILS